MRVAQLFSVGLACLLGACGGSTGGSPVGSGGSSGAAGDAGTASIFHSYDLTLTNVRVTGQSPSQEPRPMRLDIEHHGAGVRAIVTPRWGNPAAVQVEVDANRVTLTGKIGNFAAPGILGPAEGWTSVTIARAADGSLTAPIQAMGEESSYNPHGAFNGVLSRPLEADGEIRIDGTPPEIRTEVESWHGPPEAALPWDPIVVTTSEPVRAEALEGRIQVTSSAMPLPALSWSHSPASADPAAWAGSVRLTGRFQSWWDGAREVKLAIDGVLDREGVESSRFETSSSVPLIGGPVAEHGFDTDVIGLGSWGAVNLLDALTRPEPRCESGGCLLFGPFESPCKVDTAIIAGRTISTAGSISVRYRVLLGAVTAGSSEYPLVGSAPFQVDTIVPGGMPTTTNVTIDWSRLERLPEPQGVLEWATPWSTLSAPAPAANDVGFSLYAASPGWNACQRSIDPPVYPPEYPVALLVDSIGG